MNTQKQQNSMILQQALKQWQAQEQAIIHEHPSDIQLYHFLMKDGTKDEQAAILSHLSYCGECRRKMWEFEECLQDVALSSDVEEERMQGLQDEWFDVAYPLAAASQTLTTFSVQTEDHKFRICYNALADQENQGILTVLVEAPYLEVMEGKCLIVTDSQNQVLLRGEVLHGETPGEIVNADTIDWRVLRVQEECKDADTE